MVSAAQQTAVPHFCIVKSDCSSAQGIFASRHCCRTGFNFVRIDGFIRSVSSSGKLRLLPDGFIFWKKRKEG